MNTFKSNIIKSKFVRSMVESKGQITNVMDQCVKCGKCEKGCPVNALTVNRAEKTWKIDHGMCVRCQKCVKICPVSALSLVK